VSFGVTARSTTITTNGETQTVDFTGSYIKTSSITGTVTAGGSPVAATVTLTGGPASVNVSTATAGGSYTFSGLRSGSGYTVTISGYTGATFATTSQNATLTVGGTATVNFAGTKTELATISGIVTVDNEGVAGVAVALNPGGKSTETTLGGAYTFTGLAPNTYTVTITAPPETTFDPVAKQVTVGAGETGYANFSGIGPKEPATITIQSITQGGGPINLTNVKGQIEVSVNVARGDSPLDKVDVLIDDVVVATQKLAGLLAPAEAASGDVEVITLNVPTNQVRMGENEDTWVPVVYNGGANISANLYEVGINVPVPSNEVPVVMTNPDVLLTSDGIMTVGATSRINEQENDVVNTGGSWNVGGIMYEGPVYISFSTTVQTPTWTAGSCGAGVGATDGTAVMGITLSSTWACAGVEAANQSPGTLVPTFAGLTVGPDGTAVVKPTQWSALGAQFMLQGEERWYVLTPGPAGVTAPAVFDIDNKGPTITMQNGSSMGSWGVAFNALFDQPWVNASYVFMNDASWTDAGGSGVDAATRMTHLWVQGTPGSCSGMDVTTGADLAETIASDGTPDGYQICATGADLLGNVGTPSGASNWFGVDKVAPFWRFHGTTAATPAIAGTLPTVSATPNTTIYNIADGMPYATDVWGLEALDSRAGFNQNAVAGYPASQTITRQTGTVNASTTGPAAMNLALSDNYVRTAGEWAFHDGYATPGYYSYTGYVTDRAGNSTTPYVRNWLTDDVAAPTITFVTFAATFYAPGMPADFVMFGADDLEVIAASYTLDYPTAMGTLGLRYDDAVGMRWDGLNPYDASAFSTAITGVTTQVPSLVGRIDFTCSGAAAPYASCTTTDALPVTLSEFNLGGTDAGMLPLSITPVSFEDAGGNLSAGAAPVNFNVLQFSDSTAAPWDYANVPDIDFWKILAPTGTTFAAEHTASTSIEDPFFDSILLVLNDAGMLYVCGSFGVQTLSDNGINRFWTATAARPSSSSQCGMAKTANAAATYHAVGVSGNALLATQGIL